MNTTIAIAAILCVASVARGDDIARGSVVKIERDELFISLGTTRGVHSGDPLRIKRVISLKHPINRTTVVDWIPIGSARVTEAGAVLSRAIVGELTATVVVGDVAEILVEDPHVDLAQNPAALSPQDSQASEVLAIFAAQANQELAVRIAAWEHYLSQHPSSRYADNVRRDLDQLRALDEQMRPAAGRPPAVAVKLDHSAPQTSPIGQPVELVFTLADPGRVASAFLHVRSSDALIYRKYLLTREHDIYLRGVIPAELVVPPGIAYFVEVSTPDGRAAPALGTAEHPRTVAVVAPPLADRFAQSSGRSIQLRTPSSGVLRTPAQPGLSFMRLSVDALSFQNLDRRSGDRTDHLIATSLDVSYWVGGPIESIGIGYGMLIGEGGQRDEVWNADHPAPRSGLNFGYADLEVGGHPAGIHVSIGGQLIAGVGRTRFGLGGEGRIRIGDRNATNLMLGVRQLDEVGWLSQLRFATPLSQRIGIATFLGATNQPHRDDVAVQLGSEVELHLTSRIAVLGRASWQGRSIAHAGVGGGAGLSIHW